MLYHVIDATLYSAYTYDKLSYYYYYYYYYYCYYYCCCCYYYYYTTTSTTTANNNNGNNYDQHSNNSNNKRARCFYEASNRDRELFMTRTVADARSRRVNRNTIPTSD